MGGKKLLSQKKCGSNYPRSLGKHYAINSITSDFSSFSSATIIDLFSAEIIYGNSLHDFHFPPHTRTGNEEINPSSTSQSPSKQPATLCQLSQRGAIGEEAHRTDDLRLRLRATNFAEVLTGEN